MEPVQFDSRYSAVLVTHGIEEYGMSNIERTRRLLCRRGFPETHIYSSGPSTSRVEFDVMIGKIRDSRRADHRVLLFFYTHGARGLGESSIALSDGCLTAGELYDRLEPLEAKVLIATSMCFGGGLTIPLEEGYYYGCANGYEPKQLRGEYVVLTSSQWNRQSHDAAEFSMDVSPVLLALERIAQKSPAYRVNLADADFRIVSVMTRIQDYLMNLDCIIKKNKDKAELQAVRKSTGDFLF